MLALLFHEKGLSDTVVWSVLIRQGWFSQQSEKAAGCKGDRTTNPMFLEEADHG